MRLKRAMPNRHFPDYTSQGRWQTADGRFDLIRERPRSGTWTIKVPLRYGQTKEQIAETQKDIILVASLGLKGPFRTRADAINALASALAGKVSS